jgi:tRNA A37 threonylcarbamoyladenosine biosynthesis protein TsaE
MDFLEMVEWQKPTEKETYRVRICIEHKKDVENQRDERRERRHVQAEA